MIMTVIGTLSHELGHYSVSRFLGYEATINYQSSSYRDYEAEDYLNKTYKKYKNEIDHDLDFPEKEKFSGLRDRYFADSRWIIIGGPFQTMLTGTIGLILLLCYKSRIVMENKLTIRGWVFIFLALFWLRQLANLFMAVVGTILKGKPSMRGDEMRLAYAFDLNIWTIQIITGVISICVLLYVIKVIPKSQILTFLLSGLAGGISGYYLWLIKFGPVIMP